MLAFRRNSSWRGTTPWAAAAFSVGFGREWRRGTGLAGAGRQGDMGAFEKLGHIWRGVGAHEPVGGSVMDAHPLQAVEIAQQLLPFRDEAGLAGEVVEVLLHRERQEGAEDVAADGGVGGMEDRPGAHDRLGSAEEILDKEKIARVTFALVRKTKIPSKRASSASLPASISNERSPLAPALRR